MDLAHAGRDVVPMDDRAQLLGRQFQERRVPQRDGTGHRVHSRHDTMSRATRHSVRMRIEPILGRKLWFKPRRWGGWGWTPSSWEGWAVLALAVVAILAGTVSVERATEVIWVAAVSVLLVIVCIVKGTSPGGPRERAEFDRRTEGSGSRPSEESRRTHA